MNFCSNCGSDQLHLKVPQGDNLPRYICGNCGTIHYQNPKIVVGCLVVQQNQVMLCRRAIEPRKGLWNLPAGYLENGETVEEGALRETWEEAGAKVVIERLHTVYSLPHINQVYMHFLCYMQNPEYTAGPESLEVAFFTANTVPWNELAFSSTRFTLEHFFSGNQQQATYLGQFNHEPKA